MIKLFLCDVDATLTDGVYHTDEHGIISKNFYSRDFHGMYLLNKIHVDIGILSYSSDPVINAQCKRSIKYKFHLHTGGIDKVKVVIDNFVSRAIYSFDEIAYIGDDVFDIGLMKLVGWPACPKDAHPEVLEFIHNHDNGIVSQFNGGHGAVREFSDIVRGAVPIDLVQKLRKKKQWE